MIKTGKILEVEITPLMREKSQEKSSDMGRIRNSILAGEGNDTGFIGEEVVKSWLENKGIISGTNTYEYDFLFNNWKCEVKSKLTSVKPKSHYECSVANYNPNQKCDYYIFVRILKGMEKAWILGYITKTLFFERAKFLKKGELDPSNNYTVKADCYNMKISDLWDIRDLVKTNVNE